jgi:hypothetical protein
MTVELKRWFKTVGFRFDALAVMLMCEQYGIELSDLDEIPQADYTAAWCYNAHRSYQMKRYKKPLIKGVTAMKKFIAVMPKDEWDNKVLPAMVKSQGPAGDGGEKKKSHGRTS